MPISIANVIEKVQRAYSGIDDNTALGYINEAFRKACYWWALEVETRDISFVADQAKYPINANEVRLVYVHRLDSASARPIKLLAGSVREWDREDSDWRTLSSGTPTEHAVETGNIVLRPKPRTSSVGTGSNAYPRMRIEVWKFTARTLLGSLPEIIDEDNWFVAYAKRRYADDRYPRDSQRWKLEESEGLGSLEMRLGRRSLDYQPQLTPLTSMFEIV